MPLFQTKMTARVEWQSSDRQVAGLIYLSSAAWESITKNIFVSGPCPKPPNGRRYKRQTNCRTLRYGQLTFSGNTMLNFSNNSPDELLRQGSQLHNAGNFAGAEELYRQVVASEPNHPVANNLLGMIALHSNQF